MKWVLILILCPMIVFEALRADDATTAHCPAAGYDMEAIVSREEWGARSPKSTEYMELPVPHIFIHHTAMGTCTSFEECAKMMRTIQNFHMDERGWDDIGYNFLIGGDGRVYMGRGWSRVGAHTLGYNRNAVAFSLMGDFSQDPPTPLMLNATKEMIQYAQNQRYVTDDFNIHGHRDARCTECPGQAFYDIIKEWDRFKPGPLPHYNC